MMRWLKYPQNVILKSHDIFIMIKKEITQLTSKPINSFKLSLFMYSIKLNKNTSEYISQDKHSLCPEMFNSISL